MKFDFLNKKGELLSGKLELPEQQPRGFALFAHCFTCSKDFVAANVISKQLAKNGIGVLRFDFTGLGNSQGDFANTNFSSNVEDLVAACEALTEKYEAPQLLIGHSLGGAAVLKASAKISSAKAMVTIGAPSSIDHVAHLFSGEISEIEEKGQAQVKLAGRSFTIKKQFVDDIKEVDILSEVKASKKALLVLHSPIDNTVSIDHATKIFVTAKHPKSFVTLDNADHLLMKRSNAKYAGDVISAWAGRYMEAEPKEEMKIEKNHVLTKSRIDSKFTQDIYTKDHHIIADEPKSYKGDNLGMNPYDLVLAGLGACTSMTIKMYAERKGIKLDEVLVDLSHKKIYAKDCDECETESGKVDVIEKHISITGEFDEAQEKRLYEIAERCPVNRTLQSEIKIKSSH